MLSDEKIANLIGDFDWEPLRRVHNAAHDAVIGAWVYWWLNGNPKDGLVWNPGVQARFHGKRRTADILFIKDHRIVGAAEIENSPKNLIKKIKSLSLYERCKTLNSFLRFAVLSTFVFLDEKGQPEQRSKANRHRLRCVQNAIGVAKENSKQSNLLWAVYVLKWLRDPEEKLHGIRGYDYSCGAAGYCMFKRGRVVKEASPL